MVIMLFSALFLTVVFLGVQMKLNASTREAHKQIQELETEYFRQLILSQLRD